MLIICKLITIKDAKKRIKEGQETYACLDGETTFFYVNASNKEALNALLARFKKCGMVFFTDKIITQPNINLEAGKYYCANFYEYDDSSAMEEIKSEDTIYANWGHNDKEYYELLNNN